MPDLSDEETAKDPGPDINMLLSLPVNENDQKVSPALSSIPPDSEASTPFLEDQKNHGLQPLTQHTDSELPLNSELKPEVIKSERFKKLTATELDEMRDNKYAQKTKSNTKWGVNLFQEWCIERCGGHVDLNEITKEELNQKLKVFYAEAQPKQTESRKRKFNDLNVAGEYHRNTMKNARAAINRHFRDINRRIDIVKDTEFQEANDMLDAKVKTNLKTGLNLPTQHKPIIPPADLKLINVYLKKENPITLRYRIWYILSIQFVSRGHEFHPQLNRNSFQLQKDENGVEFFRLTHELKEKQNQEGVSNEKRMYASNDPETCPVKNLKYYLEKCHPEAEKLFCHVNKLAIESPEMTSVWYNTKPVAPRQFTSFMGDICRNAGIEARYTAHCLRATATQALDDAGCEIRHIMFMTGHRNEASVRSYSRGTTEEQKYKMSRILTNLSNGKEDSTSSITKPVSENVSQPMQELVPSLKPENQVAGTRDFQLRAGLFNPASCTFSNCTFSINHTN